MVADNFKKGKKAQAFGNIDKVHTFTFTPDAARATALLGNTDEAFNQVWHVPTTRKRWTTRQWIECVAREMQVESRIQAVPRWMIKALGLFIPIMREFPEMLYQNEQDYGFDSSKFERRFGWGATDPETGVHEFIRSL
jgi:nucleoside-diphosphate-sugar epimerase